MNIKSDIEKSGAFFIAINGVNAGLIILLLFLPVSIVSYTVICITSSFSFLIISALLFKTHLKEREILILTVALLLIKILFLTYKPIGSDDYCRYLWDGKVQSNGINPFLYTPNDKVLNSLHSNLLPEKVSYPGMKTIYFPLSQIIFTLSYDISRERVWGLKLFLLLCDILILVSLYYLLRKFLLPTKYILIYAALPLVYFQFFIDAHIDLFGAALMICAITSYFYEKKYLSYVLLGLSLSVKPAAFLLIPFLFQNETALKNKISSITLPISILLISSLPYVFTATPLEILINYSRHWTFNGMVYNSIKIFISDNLTIRIICGSLYFFVYVVLFFSKLDLFKKIYLSIFLLMIFSPIVHPWYLIWFAVLLPVTRSYSGLYFVSAVSLTAFTCMNYQLTGVWKEYLLVLVAQYLPITILLIYELVKNKFNQDPLRSSFFR